MITFIGFPFRSQWPAGGKLAARYRDSNGERMKNGEGLVKL